MSCFALSRRGAVEDSSGGPNPEVEMRRPALAADVEELAVGAERLLVGIGRRMAEDDEPALGDPHLLHRRRDPRGVAGSPRVPKTFPPGPSLCDSLAPLSNRIPKQKETQRSHE